jgi:hypothetical protein
MEPHPHVNYVRVYIKMYTVRVEGGSAPDDAVHLIALVKQELRQI